jgi:hypothetical protein
MLGLAPGIFVLSEEIPGRVAIMDLRLVKKTGTIPAYKNDNQGGS